MEGMVTGETKFQPKSPSPPYHRRADSQRTRFRGLKHQATINGQTPGANTIRHYGFDIMGGQRRR